MGAGAAVVAGRCYRWRADNALVGVGDVLRGRTVFNVDSVGRMTGALREMSGCGDQSACTRWPVENEERSDSVEASPACEVFEFSRAGMLTAADNQPHGQVGQVSAGSSGAGVRKDGSKVQVRADAVFGIRGTRPVRVGRTIYQYDGAGRVIETVTKRISKKPLVRRFYYAAGEQPIGFDSSDEPEVGYRYLYDGLGRRVAKDTVERATGRLVRRVVFTHAGDELIAEQTTVDDISGTAGGGLVWCFDPVTGERIGHVELTPTQRVDHASQAEIDARFYLMMADLAGAPQEIVDPDSGEVCGRINQSVYGRRRWQGRCRSPLLFDGQYEDQESGWVYNRFRYYDPGSGNYNAPDPLGLAARLSDNQGYVTHTACWTDPLGLKCCGPGRWTNAREHMTPTAAAYQRQVTGTNNIYRVDANRQSVK